MKTILSVFLLATVAASAAVVSPAIRYDNTLFVSPSGANGSAVRGRMERPWLTLSNVTRSALTGDKVKILPGTFPNHSQGIPERGDGSMAAIISQNLSNVVFEGEGNNGSVLWGTNNGIIWQLNGCSNITFRGLTFRGVNYATNAQGWVDTPHIPWGLVQTVDSGLITFENCNFEGGGAFAICDRSQTNSTPIRVFNCTFRNFGHVITNAPYGWDGAAIAAGDCTFEHSLVEDCGRGIENYAPPTGTTNGRLFKVHGCIVKDWISFGVGNSSDGGGQQFDIENCTFIQGTNSNRYGTNAYGPAISLETLSGARIRNNSFYLTARASPAPAPASVYVGGNGAMTNFIFDGNFILGGWQGLTTDRATPLIAPRITANTFARTAMRAIQMWRWTNGIIDGNNFWDCCTNAADACIVSVGSNSTVRISNNSFTKGGASLANGAILTIAGDKEISCFGNVTNGMALWANGCSTNSFAPDFLAYRVGFMDGGITISTTNGTPAHPAANGSLCLVTDGRCYLRSNTAWVLMKAP